VKLLVYCRTAPDLDNLSISQSQGRVFEKGKRRLDPRDEPAVEAALQAKKPGDEVIAIAIGEEADADALKKAFAMGVDRGVLVVRAGDGFVLANTLRAAAAKLGADAIYGGGGEVAGRVGAVIGNAPPRTPNALAIMKAAKKIVDRLDVELSEDDATPRLVKRAEYLA
jgi:electron transfer flavoprotein alpha/beta subunit